MLFNSLLFIVAFPIFCALYFVVPARFRVPLLLVGSLSACALGGGVTLSAVIGLTFVGFLFGKRLGTAPSRSLLWLSILAVLTPLLLVKYSNFVLGSVADFSVWLGGGRPDFPTFRGSVPLGLSFYTFVLIGYLVDVYLGRARSERRLANFTVFTTFFPKFVAGPVERADGFLPQLENPPGFRYDRVTDGIRIMGWGFFKKLVVADRIALIVDAVYQNPTEYHGLMLLLVSILYMFQVYYDFSSYSDIAVGAARVLGFDLIWNFNRPYAARSVSDYWRRWHISLTTWFFDYIFWPMNAALRSWKGMAVVVAMFATFVVSGLWHGAQWTFVLFGVAHAVVMSAEFLSAKHRKRFRKRMPGRPYAVLAWALTFTFLLFADIVFRAPTVNIAFAVMGNLLGGIVPDVRFLLEAGFTVPAFKALIAGLPVLKIELVLAVMLIGFVELVSYMGIERPVRERLAGAPAPVRWAVYYGVAAAIVFLGTFNSTTAFLYVQF